MHVKIVDAQFIYHILFVYAVEVINCAFTGRAMPNSDMHPNSELAL